MAKVTKIHVGISTTINLGDYENIKPEAHVEMVLDEGDNVDKVYEEAWSTVIKQLMERVTEIKTVFGRPKGTKRGV